MIYFIEDLFLFLIAGVIKVVITAIAAVWVVIDMVRDAVGRRSRA